jgi:hypothetical protein
MNKFCPVCHQAECGCKYIHKASGSWRNDDERLPLRTTLCGPQHWSKATPYRAKVTCLDCIERLSQIKPSSRRSIYGKSMPIRSLVIRRFF